MLTRDDASFRSPDRDIIRGSQAYRLAAYTARLSDSILHVCASVTPSPRARAVLKYNKTKNGDVRATILGARCFPQSARQLRIDPIVEPYFQGPALQFPTLCPVTSGWDVVSSLGSALQTCPSLHGKPVEHRVV